MGKEFRRKSKRRKKKIIKNDPSSAVSLIDDPNHGSSSDVPRTRCPKRSYAILIGYVGTGYHGMQKQPACRTVEGELETALLRAGAISPDNYGSFSRLHWSRVARTDKGVHAACQVVALRLMLPSAQEFGDQPVDSRSRQESLLVANLQLQLDLLQTNVRVFGAYRVTKQFDARLMCSKRSYVYLIPAKHLRAVRLSDAAKRHPGYRYYFQGSETEQPEQQTPEEDECGDFAANSVEIDEARLASLFHSYEGTHNFYNFSNGLEPNAKSAWRFMESLKVGKLRIEDQDFIAVTIKGQSFLLNQIRKMVALAIEVIIGTAPLSAIRESLQADNRRFIHLAPGEGLMLDRVHYDSYNERRCSPPQTPPLTFADAEEAMSEFRQKVLYKKIAQSFDDELWTRWMRVLLRSPYFKTNFPPLKRQNAV